MDARTPAENPRLTTGVAGFFGRGRGSAMQLVEIMLALTALSTALFVHTVGVRLKRDVARLVLEDRLDELDSARWRVAASDRMLRDAEAAPEPPRDRPYLVISLEERHLWYKQRGAILFSSDVATGSGKTMVKEGGGSAWKFETPRGRLVVQSKEEAPVWAPPDWHYVEQSRKRGLGLARLATGQSLAAADGSVITVEGNDVVRVLPDGRRNVLQATDGREIVVDGKLLVPPLGTTQRRYKGVLGTHRLNMGDGYAIHGTNQPDSVGRAVSHGCVRLRNEDIASCTRWWRWAPPSTFIDMRARRGRLKLRPPGPGVLCVCRRFGAGWLGGSGRPAVRDADVHPLGAGLCAGRPWVSSALWASCLRSRRPPSRAPRRRHRHRGGPRAPAWSCWNPCAVRAASSRPPSARRASL